MLDRLRERLDALHISNFTLQEMCIRDRATVFHELNELDAGVMAALVAVQDCLFF